MPGVTTAYQTGVHGSRPANGAGCILYDCTTHGLIYRDDGTTWTTFATLGGPTVTRASLGLDTTDSPQFAGLNVGAATDTTITRTGAGDVAVEGNALYRAGGTDVPLTDGGTGASTAAGARTNLGISAANTPFTPNGSIAATDVQAAIQEVRDEAASGAGTVTTVKDEGSNLSTAVVSIDFVGAGVTATGTTAVTVTIPGGSGNAHNENDAAALVNATSTGDAGSRADHFAGTSLGGAWSSEASAMTAVVKYSVFGGSISGVNHRVQAYTPSGAFRIETRLWMYTTTNFGAIGLLARDSSAGDSTGNAMGVFLQSVSGALTPRLYSLDTGSYTSRSSITSNVGDWTGWVYLALERDGSNTWTAYASYDRVNWVPSATYSKTITIAKAVLRTDTTRGGYDFFDVVS